MKRYRIIDWEDGRLEHLHPVSTKACTPQGWLQFFYLMNPTAPRGKFTAAVKDDGAEIYTKAADGYQVDELVTSYVEL
jgi:hypothetical protein